MKIARLNSKAQYCAAKECLDIEMSMIFIQILVYVFMLRTAEKR